MPLYSYIAKSFKGIPKTGTLQAKDLHDLARILRREGYLLISAENLEEKGKKKIKNLFPFFSRISLVDKLMFTRNLRVMFSAGVSLPKALRVLAEQSKSKKFKKVLLEISEKILRGKTFSQAISEYPAVFSDFFCSMIKVGEESGTLEEVLRILTRQMERDHEISSKVKGAMLYPAVIVSAMVLIGIVMMIVVVPKLAQTFEDLQIELPLTTRVIIGTGNFLAKNWYFLPFGLIALFLFFRFLIKTKIGKIFFDKLILKIPVISPIIKKMNSAQAIRTLSSLISAGVPIVKSLEIVAGTLKNIYYKKAILKTAEEVKKGAKIAEVLEKYENIFSSLVVQMIQVGEETGETAEILEKLAEFFEEEVTNATKNLSSLIEPVLMLIIGAVVGFFAISMIQPIYSMIRAF